MRITLRIFPKTIVNQPRKARPQRSKIVKFPTMLFLAPFRSAENYWVAASADIPKWKTTRNGPGKTAGSAIPHLRLISG